MSDLNVMLINMMEEQAAVLLKHVALLKGGANLTDIVAEKTEELGKKGKKKKEPVDPNKPKKPSSAYILYMGENQAPFKAANPTLSQSEVMTALGNRWSTLTAEEKEKFVKQADIRKELYGMKMAVYTAGGSSSSSIPIVSIKSPTKSPVKAPSAKVAVIPVKTAVPTVKEVVPAPVIVAAPAVAVTQASAESDRELKKKRKRALKEAEAAAAEADAVAQPVVVFEAPSVPESEKKKKKHKKSKSEDVER